jgi:hypothetical protein
LDKIFSEAVKVELATNKMTAVIGLAFIFYPHDLGSGHSRERDYFTFSMSLIGQERSKNHVISAQS